VLRKLGILGNISLIQLNPLPKKKSASVEKEWDLGKRRTKVGTRKVDQ
jgi:hypothetical protein